MTRFARFIFFLVWILTCKNGNGQVIISLLLGDKLNSGKVEFGLDGGLNLPTQTGVQGAKAYADFNLGFYFDIKLQGAWMIHSGVIVKSNMGAKGIAVYPLGTPSLDSGFVGGSVTRKLNYFNVPVLMKYKFPNQIYVEAGIQLGLLYKGYDNFVNEVHGSELTYRLKVKDEFHPLDAGVAFGVGYRLLKGNGVNIGVRYYLGLVDVLIDDKGNPVKNQCFYANVGIPIGAGKAKDRDAKKQMQSN